MIIAKYLTLAKDNAQQLIARRKKIAYRDMAYQAPGKIGRMFNRLKVKMSRLAASRPGHVRVVAAVSAGIMIFSIGYDVFKGWNLSAGYDLDSSVESILFDKRPDLAPLFQTDNQSQVISFNKSYNPSSSTQGQISQPRYLAEFSQDSKEGISITDPTSGVSIRFKPNFRLKRPVLDENRVIYPVLGSTAVKVVTTTNIGYKEDIILTEPGEDNVSYSYELELPSGVEARLENDGSLGFYGVDSALLGNISTSSEEDAKLLEQARINGEKNNLLFRSPPPYVLERNQELSTASAWYTLEGNTLTLHASGLYEANYPLSIDPSIYVESAAQLMRGNNETNVDFNVANELIQKGSTTGARIDDWAGTMALNENRWNGATAVAGGFVYNVGGMSSNSTTVVFNTAGSDTFDVPTGVTQITVKSWGAGGGGGGGSTNGDGGAGGGGGFAQATLSVTPSETLDIIVGGGGQAGTFSSGGSGNNSGDGGGGGGHTAVERSGSPIIVAPGGGGGGGGDNSSSTPGGSGGAGGGSTGSGGGASSSAPGGGGGTAGSGGAGGNGSGNDGVSGGSEFGGDGADGGGDNGCGDGGLTSGGTATGGDSGLGDDCGNGFGGGGGGGSGYFGGGGGSASISGNAGGGGGGGGSGFVTGSSTTLTGGSGATPGNSSDTDRGTAGEGGGGGSGTSPGTGGTGTDGLVIVTYSTATDDTISYVRSNGSSGTSTTLDIGTASTNRVVVVFADDESSGVNLTGATVDGNNCNLVTVADNGSGAGNHQEMWYCDEDDLGASNGSVTVAITGGDAGWAVHAHLYTGVSQGGPSDFGIDNSSVGGSTVTVNNIDVPNNGLVVMGAGNGQSGTWNSWTSPLIERTDGPNPASAVLGTASAVESTAQTNKTYVATASAGDILRGSAIVASWDHGLEGGGGNAVNDSVSWARLSTTNYVIESPNPGAGTCTGWCTDSAYDLPDERAGHSMVAYNGFLYVLGGFDDTGTRSDDVYIAKLGANGEPSLWHPTDTNKNNWVYWYQSSSYDLSSARSYLSAVAYNNRIYVLGGSTSASPGGINTVEYASLSPTGLYSSWTSTGMTTLPSVRYGHTAHAYNDFIYLIGGNSSGSLQTSVHYAKLNNDGTMNSWVAANSFSTGRSTWGGSYSTIWGGYLYLGGGCSAVNGSGYCTTIQNDIQLASINADGSLATWNTMGNVSTERIGYGFVSWRNSIYRIGGCANQDASTGDCTESLINTDYGVVNPAGEVSTVNISVPSGSSPCSGGSPVNCDLPPAGDDAGEGGQLLTATTVLNGYLYVIGGCIDYDCNGSTPAGDDDDVSGNISYVSIGSDGTLSAPSTCSGTSYGSWCVDSNNRVNGTTGVAAAGVATFANRIYIVGGLTGSGISTNIYYNSTNEDGSLAGPWSSVDMTTAGIAEDVAYTYAYARANPASAGTNPGNLFIFGGCGNITSGAGCAGSDYETEVYKCNITTTGSVSGCTTSGQLQIDSDPGTGGAQGLGIHSGTVYANYVFLVGGFSQTEGDKDDVIYARIDNNNNVVAVSGGAWIESPEKLSIGRRRGWAFGYNGHIYAVGGYDDTGTGIIPFIEWSKMNVSDGSIDSFITSSVTINQRWGLSMAISNSYAYVIGGCDVGTSPSGCSSFEPAVQTFQLYNNDSGTPAGYSDGANLFATDRLGASSAVLNGYIYIAGGCTSSPTDCTDATNSVQYAPLDEYGNIGSWSATTANLPADRAWGQLETAGGSLYYIGGQNDTATSEQSTVYYATPSSGDVATWSTASNGLPAARTQFGAAVWNNRIYVTGGNNGSAAPQTTVYISPQLNSGGNITSAWSTSTAFNVARNGHTTIAYANNLYVLGGYDGTNYLSDVQYTQINSDGTVDAWSYSTSLPTPLRQADGFANNGYMYMFGGRSADNTCLSRTLVAPISANTTIATGNNPTGVGEWYQTNEVYDGERYGNAAALYQGKAYVLGGACPTGGVQTVAFTSAGADTFVVPTGITSITVKVWGGGGGGGAGSTNGGGGEGGGGGFAQATLSVSASETLNIYVGSGGGGGTYPGTSGGGGGGGGHSEINRSGTNLIIGGGGGGGGGGDNSSGTEGGDGGGGGGTNGVGGSSSGAANGGGAGTSGSGGAGGTGGSNNGTAGGAETAGDGGNGGTGTGGENNGGQADDGDGGTAATNGFGGGGGGGGGLFGGGGGSSSQSGNAGGGGGGGGSGLVTGTSTTLTAGSGQTPGNSGDSDRSGAGDGGDGGAGTNDGSAGDNGIVVISYTLPAALTYTGSNRVQQTTLLAQPQVARYSRLIDTDTDVFPNRWLMNGVDNSIGARWQTSYFSSTNSTAAWGQETNFGDTTLGTVNTYVPLDGAGADTEFARYFYFTVSIDASQTFGYPDDVARGPTITDITLFFTADPGKRLRHGKTFTGGEKQPLDTPPGP